jgi:hypothetical protein
MGGVSLLGARRQLRLRGSAQEKRIAGDSMRTTKRMGATKLLLYVPILTLLFVSVAHSHSGGLDSQGCHHDRKRGGYHCHRAPSTETKSSVDSTKSSFVDQKQKVDAAKTPLPPQTFVGPRGGRYHYSASGKKVYERQR